MKQALALLVVVACDRRSAVTSCDDSLHGVWITEAGAKWSLLDRGKTLEAYPLFDDAVPEGAPRVIALERRRPKMEPAGFTPAGGVDLAGQVKRRYMRGGDSCEAHAPIRVTKCEANMLQIVVADPQPPAQFAACQWPLAAPSRVERWRRD
jgi:hypothetical protein